MKRLGLSAGAIQRARKLRREMSDAEIVLWRCLRESCPDQHWRHQVPFGPYHADFCSHRARIIIEVDGGQHATGFRRDHDERRTAFLNAEGYTVLRFWNHEVLGNIDGVLASIAAALSPPQEQGR